MGCATKKILAIAMLGFGSFAMSQAQAGVVTAGTGTGSPGGTVTIPISFSGDGATVDFQGDVTFDTAGLPNFTPTAVTAANGGSCAQRPAPNNNQIRVLAPPGQTTPLPAGPTTYCNVTFSINAATANGNYPLTVGGTLCFDINANSQPCTGANGQITVQTVAGPTVSYNPTPPGPIAFGPGGAGTTATLPITVDGTGGTAGQSTSVNCAFTPAAPGLSVTGGPVVINSGDPAGDTDGTFNVGCTYAAGSAQNGTLTCTATPSTGSPVQSTFNVTCPAGGATPPTIAYNPNFGTTIVFNGAGAPISQNITVSQTAAGQAGTSVSVGTCTVPAGFTTTTTPNPILFTGGSANAGGTINVTCTTQNSTGTLSCPETTNNGTGPVTVQRTWQLNCPNPSPNIVTNPANGGQVGLSGAPGTTASGTIGVQNTGFAPLTITGCTITGAGAASFGTPVVSGGGTIAAGGTGSIGLSCTTPGTGGQSVAASLSCQTNAPNATTITFPLACTAILLSIPTLGLMGKSLMALLMLGLGLVGFRLHRRFA